MRTMIRGGKLMRKLIPGGMVVIALCGATPAPAAFTDSCCACAAPVGHSGGPAPLDPALFCALVTATGITSFTERCDLAGGGVSCFPIVPGQSCEATIAEAGLACPAGVAGAPMVSTAALAALAVALGGLGAMVIRRRRALAHR